MTKPSDDGIYPLILTVPEAAEIIGLPEKTVKELAESGRIRAERVANRYRIPRAACEEYAASLGAGAA